MYGIDDKNCYNGPNRRNQRIKKYNIKDSYKVVSWIFSCVNIIADSISGVPVIFYTKGKEDEKVELDINHPLMQLFNPPMQWQIPSIVELIKIIFINLGLFGEIFLEIEKARNIPINISLKSPFDLEPVFKKGSNDKILEGWIEKDISGRVKRLYKPGELLQFKYPNPYSDWRGLSPLLVARLSIEQELNMSIWNADFFKGGAKNPFAILTKARLNPKQRKEKLDELRKNYYGFINGQLPLLLDGEGDIKTLMNTLKDIDFFNGKQLSREEICSIYNVAPALVGIYRYANYANSKEQEKLFWQNCTSPKMRYFLSVIQTGLLNIYYPGVLVDFNWDTIDVLKKDDREIITVEMRKAQTVKTYMEIGYTRSEVATLLNDPNLDPDVIDEPDEPEIPEEPDKPDEPDENARVIIAEKNIEIVDNVLNGCIDIKTTDEFVDSFRQGYHRNVLDKYEPKWLRLVKSFLSDAEKQLIKYIQKNRDNAMLSELVWVNLWKSLANDIIENIYYDGIRKSISDIESPKTMLNFEIKQPADLTSLLDEYQLTEMKKSIDMVNSKTVGLSSKMIEQLNDTSKTLITQGTSLNQIRKGIHDKVGEIFKTNSLTVARTVTGSAYNTARFQGATLKGGYKHTWVDAGDEVVRRTHKLENTNEVVIGERFPVTQLLHPLDPNGRAAEIINCRCSTFISALKKPGERARPTPISIQSPQRTLYNKIESREAGIQYNNKETAIAFNKQGEVVVEKVGSETSVRFTKKELEKIEGNIFTHNHPSSKSFSEDDIGFAFKNKLSEMRVTSAEYQYSLTSKVGNLDSKDLKDVMVSYSLIKQKTKTKLLEMVHKNIIGIQRANELVDHLTLRKLVNDKFLKKLGLVYSRRGLI